MKKLMIAAAIVCAAAMSHAAAFEWDPEADYDWAFKLTGSAYAGYKGTTIGGDYTASYASGATAYLILGDLDTSDLLGYLRDGKTMTSTEIAQYVLGDATIGDNGKFTEKTLSIKGAKMYEDGGDYYMDAFLAIVSGDNVYLSDAEQLAFDQFSTEGDASFATSYTKKLRDNDATRDYGSAGWYATAVPEPTSGLLLLLGVAGLALRRRRA